MNNIPTHYLNTRNNFSIVAQKVDIIPLEVVLRNTASGSICKQTTLKPGTVFEKPLIDFYLKNDELNDPLLTIDRIILLEILKFEEINLIKDLTYRINTLLKEFFLKIDLILLILSWNME